MLTGNLSFSLFISFYKTKDFVKIIFGTFETPLTDMKCQDVLFCKFECFHCFEIVWRQVAFVVKYAKQLTIQSIDMDAMMQ